MPSQSNKKTASVFSTGMALFSMFFGAGNLIFPLVVGGNTGNKVLFALLGLGFSAVVFPFLGLIAAMLYGGNLKAFLEKLGAIPSLILLFILYAAQGPFCAMPRLVTLMHASFKPYFPELSLFVFSLAISALTFFLAIRPRRMISLLGVVLTPLFLLGIALLVGVGMSHPSPAPEVLLSSTSCFWQGLKGGYQTMDLIAALLFATIVIPHLSRGMEGLSSKEAESKIGQRMKGASLIAAGLLMVTYIALCWLSAHYKWTLSEGIFSEDLLQAIATKILGPWGGIVAAITTFLACITTAISLGVVFADYLRKDLFKNRISPALSLLITLGFTAAMANLGFGGIVRLFEPILTILYPALLVLCLFNIFSKRSRRMTTDLA